MSEITVFFLLAAIGSMARLSIDFALQFISRKIASESIVTGPEHSASAQLSNDLVISIGLTLSSYGAMALALIMALPGDHAVRRTWFAFAVLCLGGVVCEICRTRTERMSKDLEFDDSFDGIPASVGLSWTLMIALNLALAVLVSGQGLVGVIPPEPAEVAGQSLELEPIVVVAGREADSNPDVPGF